MPRSIYTCNSEYQRLTRVLVCPPSVAFISEEKIRAEWKDLNFLEAPGLKKSEEEYRRFCQLLEAEGIQLEFLPFNSSLSLDAIYCRDSSIATDHGMIVCSMGKAQRDGEPDVHLKFYEASGIEILGRIEPPGTLEGGDVAWLDEKTLAVGHSYRTNEAGIDQLKAMLKPFGIAVIEVSLPHYRGHADVFHLMSVFSPVDKDLAVVYSPLMPVRFRNLLLKKGFELVEVDEKEFLTLGCNVLALAPRYCLISDGHPNTVNALKSKGCRVVTYKGDEISIKGGGGPTCLTRPLQRLR